MKRLVVSQTSTRLLHKRVPPALPLATRSSLRDHLGDHVLFKVASGELDHAVRLLYIIRNMPFNLGCFKLFVCHSSDCGKALSDCVSVGRPNSRHGGKEDPASESSVPVIKVWGLYIETAQDYLSAEESTWEIKLETSTMLTPQNCLQRFITKLRLMCTRMRLRRRFCSCLAPAQATEYSTWAAGVGK